MSKSREGVDVPRQLAMLFPDGTTEWWLTTRTFEVGDALHRGGKRWVVTSISTPVGFVPRTQDGDLRHATVTVRAEDAPESRAGPSS